MATGALVPSDVPPARRPAFEFNARMARSVNLAGNFEFPGWQPVPEVALDAARDAGFTGVRIVVGWADHRGPAPEYTVDADYLAAVDATVEAARRRGLAVVVENHNDEALTADPAGQRPRFLALWRQLAAHWASAGDDVAFDLLNEPHGALDGAAWNALLREAVAEIRAISPQRILLVEPGSYAGAEALDALVLPDDPLLIASIHDYRPQEFTHQGAAWVNPVPPVGVTFPAPGRRPVGRQWSDDGGQASTWTDVGVTITPTKADSYLQLVRTPGLAASRVGVTVDRDMELVLRCLSDAQGAWPTGVTVAARAGVEVRVDTAACGSAEVASVVVMAGVGEPLQPWSVTGLTLTSHGVVLPVIGDDVDVAVAPVRQAAVWGRANQRPVNLREFGAYEAAPTLSRARWAATVRTAEETAGVSWTWWEFSDANFSQYSSATGQWRRPLLGALLPGSPLR